MTQWRRLAWPAFLVLALLLLGVQNGALYGVLVPLGALALATVVPLGARPPRPQVDRRDLRTIAVLYVTVVSLFLLAFQVFTQDRTAGLFLCFAAGLLVGFAGPIYYTVWRVRRPLSDLGLSRDRLPATLALGVTLAVVQFALTLWGYDLPRPVDWVPLLVMALTVGLFEAVFFRGFIQTRLTASFGPTAGIGGAALLYAAYHVGYGMGPDEMLFLFGLGVVYAIAFASVRNVLVLWPLLVPMGSFFNSLEAGDITMPWAAIIGFSEVLGLMALTVVLAVRHSRRQRIEPRPETPVPVHPATAVGAAPGSPR